MGVATRRRAITAATTASVPRTTATPATMIVKGAELTTPAALKTSHTTAVSALTKTKSKHPAAQPNRLAMRRPLLRHSSRPCGGHDVPAGHHGGLA